MNVSGEKKILVGGVAKSEPPQYARNIQGIEEVWQLSQSDPLGKKENRMNGTMWAFFRTPAFILNKSDFKQRVTRSQVQFKRIIPDAVLKGRETSEHTEREQLKGYCNNPARAESE